jgi:hypothetical protein
VTPSCSSCARPAVRTSSTALICATVVVSLTIIGSVVLGVLGGDYGTFERTVNTLLNAVGAVTGLGGFLYAGAAARSSEAVRERLDEEQL